MKRTLKSKYHVSCTQNQSSKKRGKISIPLNELITAVSHLGNNISELDKDKKWRSCNSLWSQVAADLATRLPIHNDLRVRKYIYTIWYRESAKLRSHFTKNPLPPPTKIAIVKELSCIPSLTKVRTRSKESNSAGTNGNTIEHQQHLIEFTYEEWRNIYKKEVKSHDMDSSWTDVFYDKLVDSKLITCSIVFTYSKLRQLYTRKMNSPLFKCNAHCPNSSCPLTLKIKMVQLASPNRSVFFRVEIFGTPRHDNPLEINQRHVKGDKRAQMAKIAKEQGILATYEKNLLNANNELLKCNNYTEVPTTHVITTAVKQQSDEMCLDKNIFVELEMMLFSMRESDKDSHLQNKGFIQVFQIWPFQVIFYTEAQLLQYIEYCLSTRESCIHIDATGSVVKQIPNQRKPYLYLICFKDGKGACNLLPLAGALLVDHSAASIENWLNIVRRGVSAIKNGRFTRPSCIVIDFSPALLNAALLSINNTSIQSYLQWFCCAHVMNAFGRSLSKLKLKKHVRRKAMQVFSILLNCNEMNQCYDLIGLIIWIFGSNELDTTEQVLDQVIKAGADYLPEFEEFFEDDSITKGDNLIEQELAELDDIFLSSQPILHQSAFTKLARERSPILSKIIDESKGNKEKDIKNPLFSKELVKIFYKWIAYLPIFTGLMYQFQDRYASDSTHDVHSKTLSGGRVSNAPIESFFKILKHSILRQQTNLRPGEFLLKLYSTTNARLKANQLNIQQTGSKKRGRRKKQQVDQVDRTLLMEQWKKQGTEIASRGVYFSKYVEQKLVPGDIRSRLREKLQMRQDRLDDVEGSDNMAYISTMDTPFEEFVAKPVENVEVEEISEPVEYIEVQGVSEPLQELNANTNSILPVTSHETKELNSSTTTTSSSSPQSKVNKVYEKDINVNESAQTILQQSHHTYENNKQVIEFRLPKNWPTHTTVGNLKLQFPHFNIGPTFISSDRQYSASNTCSLDSSLFLLYYIYMSHSDEFRSLFDSDIKVCDRLRKTFDLVESKGWDLARMYWITANSIYSNPKAGCAHIDLYGTADTNVFQYVREIQKHVIESTCTCSECPKPIRHSHSADISLPQVSGRNRRIINLINFSEQFTTICGATIGPDEPTTYNGSYIRDDFFPAKHGNGITAMFICNSNRIAKPHQFVYKSPPILLLNVGKSVITIEKNKTAATMVKDLPFALTIGKQRYNLAGAICPQANHFTATIVCAKGRFSKYDDLNKFGIKNNEGGDDVAETAIYAIETQDNDN
ncbi:unnamed protein product, partial [Adineta steineri]